MLPPIEELGLVGSLGFKTSAKKVIVYNQPYNNNFFPTCSLFRIRVIISFVICIFKNFNSFVVCEYSLIPFVMEGGSLDKHHFLLVAFLLGLPLMSSKLHALVIGETISNV